MKTKYIIFIAAVLSLISSSCFRDELYDRYEPEPEPEPVAGKLTVTVDWSGISSDAEVPASYNIVLGGKKHVAGGATNVFEFSPASGVYELSLYNSPAGITVSGDNATVNSPRGSGEIEAMPEYLFSGRVPDLVITPDSPVDATVKMKQHVRRLNIVLTVVIGDHSRIVSAESSLSGAESGINHRTGERASNPATVKGAFVKSDRRLTVSYNLLGIVHSSRPKFVTRIVFSDGSSQTVESDLSENLREFHNDVEPLTLSASLEVPEKAGIKATISNWCRADGGNVDAH